MGSGWTERRCSPRSGSQQRRSSEQKGGSMRFRVGREALVVLSLTCALLFMGPVQLSHAQGGPIDHWVGTWATAGVASPSQASAQAPPGQPAKLPSFNNQTLRQFVHTSIGGERVRVVLTNAFGTRALAIGGAHVGLRDKGGAIVSSSDRTLTFGGAQTTVIPPGAILVSDPVNLVMPQ